MTPFSSLGLLLFIVSSFPAIEGIISNSLPIHVQNFDFAHASVGLLTDNFASSGKSGLLLTAFSPFGADSVSVVRNAGTLLDPSKKVVVDTIETVTSWPNKAAQVLDGILPGGNATVLVAGGFFVSAKKSTGTVDLFNINGFPDTPALRTKISEDKKGYFYHETHWFDINGDGLQDVVAARAFDSTNPFEKAASELIWIEQPQGGGQWKTHVLYSGGPGVGFIIEDLNKDGKVEIIATQFFVKQQLAIFSCEKKVWSACNQSNIDVTVVDEGDGAYFNVQWIDLNADGRNELLATTNVGDGSGKVYAFEMPSQGFKGTWTKHVLADGYKIGGFPLPGQGSPGTARAFWIDSASKSAKGKPSILVSADDAGWVDLLNPTDKDFVYSKNRVINSTGTIGTLAIGDANDDGVTDFFAPLYKENKVGVYTFAGEP